MFNQYNYRLKAMATGPKGYYVAGYSPTFYCAADLSLGGGQQCGTEALNVLTKSLYGDGWIAKPPGRFWYNARFMREVKPDERLEKSDEARADREAAQAVASESQTSARTAAAIDFIVYLHRAGVHLKPTSPGGLAVGVGKLGPEAKAKLDDLLPEMIDLLRPGNDRGAAMILLAYLRANKVELYSPSPGVVRVTRGKLSRETEAELKRLVPQVAELLAVGSQ